MARKANSSPFEMFIDSHCHLNFPELASRLDEVMNRMRENRVSHALCVCVTLEEYPQVRMLAERYPSVYGSVGLHPDYENVTEVTVDDLVRLADHRKIIAIGETGLDYYRVKGDLEW
jgi:TatD DNase family protein